MNRGNNVPWTDFDKAWRSVEELKEELKRTEIKLQSTARSFTWDRPRSHHPNIPHQPSSATHVENAGTSKSQATPSTLQTTAVRNEECDIGNEVPNSSVEVLREKKPKPLLHKTKISEKQKSFRTTLERLVLNLSTDGSLASTMHRDIKNGNALPSATYCHEWLNALDNDNVAFDQGTANRTEPATGKSSGVIFTAWDRQYLKKELSDFEISGSQEDSVEPQLPVETTTDNSAIQRTKFVFQKSNFLPQRTNQPQKLPVKIESLECFHKLREIVGRQRERSNAAVNDIETDTNHESSSSSGERMPVKNFIPKARLVDAATGTDSLMEVDDHKDEPLKVLPVRKVSAAPLVPGYKGFSLLKALPAQVPFRLEMGKVGVSPRIVTKARRRARPTTKLKEVITPFSWREGQRLANEYLGPPPQMIFKSAQDLPREKESSFESPSKSESAGDSTVPKASTTNATESNATDGKNETEDLTDSPESKSIVSKTENKENTSPDTVDAAKQILNFMAENESEAEISDQDEISNYSDLPTLKPPFQIPIGKKRKAGKSLELKPPPPKVRHYDREKILEYIEKQRLQRRQRSHEEHLKKVQAEQAKRERLQKLFEYQKLAAKTAVKVKPVHPLKVVHDNIKIAKRIDYSPFTTSAEFVTTKTSGSSNSKLADKIPLTFDKNISVRSNPPPPLNVTQTIEASTLSQEDLPAVDNPVFNTGASLEDTSTLQTHKTKDLSSTPLHTSRETSKKIFTIDSITQLSKHSFQNVSKLKDASSKTLNSNVSEKYQISNSAHGMHKVSDHVSEKHKVNDHVSEKHKVRDHVSEKHKVSDHVSEKHKVSDHVSEKRKVSDSVPMKHKGNNNVPEKHKGSGKVQNTDSNSPLDDSLSGISSLHTASVAKELSHTVPSEMHAGDISAQNMATPYVPLLVPRDVATSLEEKGGAKMQQIQVYVQQNTAEITIPIPSDNVLEGELSIKSERNDSSNEDKDSYISFRERISRIGSMEDINKFFSSSRSRKVPHKNLVETKSLDLTDSENSSHESFFTTQRNIFIGKESNLLGAQSNEKEWKFPWLSTEPDPHNFINTWKRKPLAIPLMPETTKKDDTNDVESDKSSEKNIELGSEEIWNGSSISKHLEEKSSYSSFSTDRESLIDRDLSKSTSTVDKPSSVQLENIVDEESIMGKTSSESENIGRSSSAHTKSTIGKPSETSIGNSSFKLKNDVQKPVSKSQSSEFSELLSVEKNSLEDNRSDSLQDKQSMKSDQQFSEKESIYGQTASESSDSEIFEGTEITKLSQIKVSDECATLISSESESAISVTSEAGIRSSESVAEKMTELHHDIYTEASNNEISIPYEAIDSSVNIAPSFNVVSSAHTVSAVNTVSSVTTISSDQTASSANTVAAVNTMSFGNTSSANVMSSSSMVSSINAVSTGHAILSANIVSSANIASSVNTGITLSNTSVSIVSLEDELNASKENSKSVEELSQRSSSNQDGSVLEDDVEINTKSLSQDNASEYLTPENLSDEILRTSESPESRFSDAKVENEEKTVQVGLADPFLDPTTITRVVTQAATAAATSAVMAVLESQGSFANKKVRLETEVKSLTPSSSSKQEYSSDFENTQGTPSDRSSIQQSKSQASSDKEIEESLPKASASDNSEVKEDLVNENVLDEDASLSIVTVQSVHHRISYNETSSERYMSDKERSPQKKRKRSENISSPSPASLSDNDSLPSSAISSSESSGEQAGNQTVNLTTDSFTQLTLDMLRRMIQDEELRAREKLTYFKSEEKNLVEKFHIEMRWLQSVKKRLREKGSNTKLPLIKEKEEELISRLRQERAQLRSLQETYRSYSQKQHALLLEKKKLFVEPSSPALQKKERFVPLFDKAIEKTTHSTSHSVSSLSPMEDVIKQMDEDKSQADVPEGVFDSSSSVESCIESQNASASKPSHSTYNKHSKSMQSSSQRPSKQDSNFSHSSQQPSFSLESILQGLKRLEASKRYLTKKEQRLVQRRKHVEDLLQWQTSLDHEEKDVKELEHKAVEMLEKSKHRSKYYVSSSVSSLKNDSPSQETTPANQPIISSAEVASSEKEVTLSSSLKTTPPSNENGSVQEILSHRSSSKSEIFSSERISDDIPVQSQNSSDSTIKEEKASVVSITTTMEDVIESHQNSLNNTSNEILSSKSSPASPSMKEKSASSEADSYSDSFILSNEAANASTPTQHKKLASIKSRLSSSIISRMIGRKNRRQDSSGSDDSFTISHSETASDQSDIEGRIYALSEELRRRKLEAEKLRKEQKKRYSEQLKDKELSLKKQLEAYDKYIQDVSRELEVQLQAVKSKDSLNQTIPSVKPQIKQPRVAKSRQLQKQLSASSDSLSDVRSSENESSGILDVSLLPKERKPQSSSHLAKKLRAIETKDSTTEHIKESISASSSLRAIETKTPSPEHIKDNILSSSSSIQAIETKDSSFEHIKENISASSPIRMSDTNDSSLSEHFKENISASSSIQTIETKDKDSVGGRTKESSSILSSIPDVASQTSTKTEKEELVKLPSEQATPDHKELGSSSTVASDSNLSHNLEFTSDDSSPQSSKKSEDRSSENSITDVEEKTAPSEKKREESFSDPVIESSLEASEISDIQESIRNDKFPSTDSENFESYSTVNEGTLEEESKNEEFGKTCSTPDGCKTPPPKIKEVIFCTEEQKKTSENSAILHGKNQIEPAEELSKLSPLVSEVHTEEETLSATQRKILLVDAIVEDVLCKVCEDTKNVALSLKRSEISATHKRVVPKLPTSLKDIHEKAAISVSETLTESLFQDALQTLLKLLNCSSHPLQTIPETSTRDQDISDENSILGDFSHLSLEISSRSDIGDSQDSEKRNDFVEKQEWFDDDILSLRNEGQSQAYDQQQLVRQYPYLYRQIPNKPPPPYTPPSSPIGQKYIYSQKEEQKEPETVNIIRDSIERLNDVVEECINCILEGKAQGLSLKDIEPPSQYTYTESTDLGHTNQLIFKTFLFELTRETAMKLYAEVKEEPKPWLRNQKLAGKPLLPKTKEQLLPRLQDEIQKIMKLKANDEELGMWSSMKLGRKQRDFVDTIIISELREEEPEWVNYDQDEFTLKLTLTESIFKLLVDDTINVLKELDAYMFGAQTEET